MPKELRPEAINTLVGTPAVNDEFVNKVRELDRRLQLNGMYYRNWDGLNDRQQDIFTKNLFLDGESASSVSSYVGSAVSSCACADTLEDLHHHSPILIREIEKQQELAPDVTVKIGESIGVLDQAIDLLLEQLLGESQDEPVLKGDIPSEQKALKKFLNKIFEREGLGTADYARTGHHLRGDSPIPNSVEIAKLKPWFAKYDIDIKEYYPTISGKFDSFILSTTQDISAETLKDTYGISGVVDIPSGTPLFYVPKVLVKKEGKAQRYIKDKALNPDSLGLGSDTKKWRSTSEIAQTAKGAVTEKYPSPTYPDWVASELVSLLASTQAQGLVVKLKEDLQFGNQDLAVISKDFGETLGALWAMAQAENKQFSLPYRSVIFPSNPAEELVDFYGFTEEDVKIPVSVKSGTAGGKVQITNVIEAAKILYEISEGVEGALSEEQQFIAVANTNPGGTYPKGMITGNTQPLYLHKILREDPDDPASAVGTRTIKKLAEIMSATGMQISWEDITRLNVKEWLESKTEEELLGNRMPEIKDVANKKTGTVEKRYVEPSPPEGTKSTAILQPLWDIAGSTPNLSAYKQARRDKMLLVCSPMGQQAENLLNDSQAIQDELNRLAQTLTVIQANVNAKKNVMTFALNKFRDATFIFKWPGYVAGNYMGFLMVINK